MRLLPLEYAYFDTPSMSRLRSLPGLADRPRAIVLGSPRDPLGLPSDGLDEALLRVADVQLIPAGLSPIRAAKAIRAVGRAVADGFELVHLHDARLAPLGMILQRQAGVPVSVSIVPSDLSSRTPIAKLARRALNHLDHAFASESGPSDVLARAMPSLPVSFVRPAARPLPPPSERAVRAVSRSLRDVRPGRLVIAMPWPENRNDLRWFRDCIMPHLDARPLCLVLGAPSRRAARLLLGPIGASADFRIHSGSLNADLVSAAARFADVFAVPAGCEAEPRDGSSDLAITLAMGGIPVVTDGAHEALVLAHERNAFVVDRGDEREFAATLNNVLSLPAQQRHYLGVEFARFTLARWSWDAVAEVYGERFAALVGRPQIPFDLRAA
jgi:hypothetical protein